MKILVYNAQLFPTDSALIRYRPEDESSPERALIMSSSFMQNAAECDVSALMGAWSLYALHFVHRNNPSTNVIYPTGVEVIAEDPPELTEEPKDSTDTNPRFPTPKDKENALKKAQEDFRVVPPGERIRVTKAGNGMYITSAKAFIRQFLFEIYRKRTENDKGAAKGYMAVFVENWINIVFTHLQDDYVSDGQHSNVRQSQLDQLNDWINVNQLHPSWIFGDFNIRASQPRSHGNNEYERLLDSSHQDFTNSPIKGYTDAWLRYMVPKSTAGWTFDRGFNAVDRRLNSEYRTVSVLSPIESGASAYHIRLPSDLKHGSDRYATTIEFGLTRPHCCPATAITFDMLNSSIEVANLDFDGPHGPRWIYLAFPFTYSILTADDRVEFEVYSITNISQNIVFEDKANLNGTPWDQIIRDRLGGPYEGLVFDSTVPLLVKVKLKKHHANTTDTIRIAILKHDGGTRGTAITLSINTVSRNLTFPSDQALPPTDTLWVRLPTPHIFSNSYIDSELVFTKSHGDEAKFLLDIDTQPSVGGLDSKYTINHTLPPASVLYGRIMRANLNIINTAVEWKGDVSFLHLDRPFYLYINDETGTDWLGDDEVTVWLADEVSRADFFNISFLDADTGDNFDIGNSEELRTKVQAKNPRSNSISFVKEIIARVLEDDFDDDNRVEISISALDHTEIPEAGRSQLFDIQSGQYSLKYHLSNSERL